MPFGFSQQAVFNNCPFVRQLILFAGGAAAISHKGTPNGMRLGLNKNSKDTLLNPRFPPFRSRGKPDLLDQQGNHDSHHGNKGK